MAGLTISLLGHFDAALNGEPITGFPTKRTQALLAFLVTEHALGISAHGREALMELLWPGLPLKSARGNLRQTLYYLRKVIPDRPNVEGRRANSFLASDRFTIRINQDFLVRSDVANFISLLEQTEEAWPQAVSLYRGDFLTDFFLPDTNPFEEWAASRRAAFRRQVLDALYGLAEHHISCGNYHEAEQYGWRQLEIDNLREETYRQLMQLFAWTGRTSDALNLYQLCARILDEEMGTSPDEMTTALYNAILEKRLPPPSTKSPASSEIVSRQIISLPESRQTERLEETVVVNQDKAHPHISHNLPAQTTPFIGRKTELAELDELLADQEIRLITIVGPGGIGKTRLALAAAEWQLEQTEAKAKSGEDFYPLFPDGIYFVSLTPLISPDHIVPTIAEALGLRLQSGQAGGKHRPAKWQLLDYLHPRQLLLVMDNFEHLLDAAFNDAGTDLLTLIMQTAAGVRLLVTSRERLSLHEEQVFPIQGLEYPIWDKLPSSLHSDEVIGYSAVKLFLECSRRVQPGFEPRQDGLTSLIRICHQLDGLPLGIELAASWIDMLPLADIVMEIDHSLDFLESDWRDVSERHHSMRAVFDTTWRRLGEGERSVFSQLSIFRGGFSRRAAQAVVGASLRDLAALAKKSLLYFDEARSRYQIHELLRQYGAEKLSLDPAGKQDVCERHSAYYCAALQERLAELRGSRQEAILAEIEADVDNVWAAWDWAAAHGQIEDLAKSLDVLGSFFDWRGRHEEGERAFRLATEQLSSFYLDARSQLRVVKVLVKAITWQALFAFYQAGPEITSSLLRKAQDLITQPALSDQDTRQERAFILFVKGRTLVWSDSREKILHLLEESLALYRDIGDKWNMANVLEHLATAAWLLDRYEESWHFAQNSLELRQELGDARGIAGALDRMGLVANYMGQFEDAKRYLQEAVRTFDRLGDPVGLARATGNLGSTFMEIGDFLEARKLYQRTVDLLKNAGIEPMLYATYLTFLGMAESHLGQLEEADLHVQNALALSKAVKDPRAVALALLLLGRILCVEQKFDQASRCLLECVELYRAHQHRGELLVALCYQSLVELGLENQLVAELRAYEALQMTMEIRNESLSGKIALVVIALLLAERGKTEQAVELYGLMSSNPYVSNSWWYQRVAGDPLEVVLASLPSDVAEAAWAKGQALDFWQVAERLIEELPEAGWGICLEHKSEII